MAKVYVITAGSYSDYHICAVSLDPQKAEVLAKFYTKHGYDEAGVEEYDADYEYDRIESGCQMYIVTFDKQGDVEHLAPAGTNTRENVFSWGEGVMAEVWAKDAKSAVKIAAEKRAMYLAEKEGIT